MKKYVKPTLQIIKLTTTSLLASSVTLNVSEETHDGGFNARSLDFDDEEYE